MIELGDRPTPAGELPRIMGLGAGLAAGEVVVVKQGASQLEDGKSVVLATSKGTKFELTTRHDVPEGTDNRDGTFVCDTVSAVIGGDFEKPTLRLYSSADVIAKIRSKAGMLLAISTALALITAGASSWFEFAGDSGPSPAQTARDTQALLTWATAPELAITPGDSAAMVAQTRNELDRRQRLVNACLEERRGGAGGPENVSGIACSATTPSFIRNKDNAAPTAALLGIIAAVIAAIGAFRQFRPGTSPS